MILFFDTETTGFFQDRLPVDHPDQPYIVQLAAQLCEDDGAPLAGFCFIVDPGIGNGVGAPVYDDNGNAWRDGYASVGRRATPKEVADAAALDVRNFGRRYRREGYAK